MRRIYMVFCALALTACQHQALRFTHAQPPKVVPLENLVNAPAIAAFSPLVLTEPRRIALSDTHFVHLLPVTNTDTIEVKVVGYNRHGMWRDADTLMYAFREVKPDLALVDPASSAKLRQSHASVHQFWTGSINGERSTLSSISFKDTFAQDLQFLTSLWINNPFSAIHVDRLKRQMKLNARGRQFFGSDHYQWWNQLSLGSSHPYIGLLSSAETVNALNQKNVNAIWDAIRHADEWHIFIAGDIEAEQLSPDLRAQILALPLANQQKQNSAPLPTPTALTIHVVDTPGDVQTNVVMGYALADTGPENSLACAFISQWLGASFSGRLFADLREQRGLAYSVGGGCEQKPLALMLRFTGATRLENTGAFVAGIRDHLRLATQNPISDEELKLVKQQLLSVWRIALDTPENQLDIYAHLLHMGRQWSTLLLREQRLAEINAESVQSFAKTLLANEPVIVLRTDASKVLSDLRAKFPEARIVVEKSIPEIAH